MSVGSLSTSTVYVYSASDYQDAEGAHYETWTLKYANIPVRLRYLQGRESLIEGKIQVIPRYRIYFPSQYAIVESDLIIDAVTSRKYDVQYVNKMDRKRHMQVDTIWVDTLLGDFCPNIIHSITCSVVLGAQPSFVPHSYRTVDINGTTTKDHFIQVYTGSTTGKTSSDKVFYGDAGTGSVRKGWQSIVVNGMTLWTQVWSGTATSSCCTDMNGTSIV